MSNLDKYEQRGRMPKNTRVNMTLWMLSVVDIAIVGGLGFLGFKIGEMLSFSFLFQVIITILNVIIGIGLVMRTNAAPKTRTWRVLVNAVKMNQTKYFPIRVEQEGGNRGQETTRKVF